MKPIIKWAGGKTAMLDILIDNLPQSYGKYFEPFLGGGALFFALKTPKSNISDINQNLCDLYSTVAYDLNTLLEFCDIHQRNHSKDYYYQKRLSYNHDNLTKTEKAAVFLYLNKSCFNGLYRVNKSGSFNTPVGSYKEIKIYDRENISKCSDLLKKAQISCKSYDAIKPKKGDLIYLDPPYHNCFNSYVKGGFSSLHQRKLSDFCQNLDRKGVFFSLSSSDTPLIRHLYKEFKQLTIQAPRSISCNGDRGKNQELLIKNY